MEDYAASDLGIQPRRCFQTAMRMKVEQFWPTGKHAVCFKIVPWGGVQRKKDYGQSLTTACW